MPQNPFMNFSVLPDFSQATPELAEAALEHGLAELARVGRDAAASSEPVWENYWQPVRQALENLGRIWGQVDNLFTVNSTADWRAVVEKYNPQLTAAYSNFYRQAGIYSRLKNFAGMVHEPISTRVINNFCRDFKLSGVELNSAGQKKTPWARNAVGGSGHGL